MEVNVYIGDMLSIYIHIPFCDRKCWYCSFHVMATEDLLEPKKIIWEYLNALHKQIDVWWEKFKWEEIKTIYFGGGTPSSVWSDAIIKIIDHIGQYFSFEYIEELWIEVNPYPDYVLWFIDDISEKYRKWPKVRFSIGVQSFDNEVLELSGRKYTSAGIMEFFRNIVPLKKWNVSFNFDFIAFGKFNSSKKWNEYLWTPKTLEFFKTFADSGFADGFSLYTLELFEWSEWFHKLSNLYSHKEHGLAMKKFGNDDQVYEEFSILKDLIDDAGYERYEISNFSHAGRNSIHNRVYRNMGDYLAFGTSASGFLSNPKNLLKAEELLAVSWMLLATKAIRRTNTKKIADFLQGQYIDVNATEILSAYEFDTEKVFLWLRTKEWIKNLSTYSSVLELDRNKKVENYKDQWFAVYVDDNLRLTDAGMDLYNDIITDLLKF